MGPPPSGTASASRSEAPPASNSTGHLLRRPGLPGRNFPIRGQRIYDFCPLLGRLDLSRRRPRWGFEKFFSEDLIESDVVIADFAFRTKADAAWLCPMPQDRIKRGIPWG